MSAAKPSLDHGGSVPVAAEPAPEGLDREWARRDAEIARMSDAEFAAMIKAEFATERKQALEKMHKDALKDEAREINRLVLDTEAREINRLVLDTEAREINRLVLDTEAREINRLVLDTEAREINRLVLDTEAREVERLILDDNDKRLSEEIVTRQIMVDNHRFPGPRPVRSAVPRVVLDACGQPARPALAMLSPRLAGPRGAETYRRAPAGGGWGVLLSGTGRILRATGSQ